MFFIFIVLNVAFFFIKAKSILEKNTNIKVFNFQEGDLLLKKMFFVSVSVILQFN